MNINGPKPSDPPPIPVSVCRRIAEEHDRCVVVLFAIHNDGKVMSRTTYGVTAEQKEYAAGMADFLERAMRVGIAGDFHEDFRRDFATAEPSSAALFKEAVDLLQTIVARNGVTAPQLQQAERLVKAATGRGRQG